nr:transcription repressor NadR [Kandleria vitulina]
MMKMDRKQKVIERITQSEKPLSASALAKELGVSRQIIVGDVALLRASGHKIIATPRGYVIDQPSLGISKTIAVKHDDKDMEKELNLIIDMGGYIENVIVEHPVYGEIKGNMKLKSRYDILKFMEKVNNYDATSLSSLTGGVHLHTIYADSTEILDRIEEALKENGFLLE